MENRHIKFSIIVPIYNAEAYLERTLQSIVSQTYLNLEIILVNDGSEDHSADICRRWATSDSRIIFINNKENRGVSHARNLGLKIAQGEYISFIDGDDTVEVGYLKSALHVLDRNGFPDILVFGFFSEKIIDGRIVSVQKIKYSNRIYTRQEFAEGYFQSNASNSVWNKVFKRDLLGDVTFDEGLKLGEDLVFCLNAYSRMKNICFCDACFYHYRIYKATEHAYYSTIIDFEQNIENLLKRVPLYHKMGIPKKLIKEDYERRVLGSALSACDAVVTGIALTKEPLNVKVCFIKQVISNKRIRYVARSYRGSNTYRTRLVRIVTLQRNGYIAYAILRLAYLNRQLIKKAMEHINGK